MPFRSSGERILETAQTVGLRTLLIALCCLIGPAVLAAGVDRVYTKPDPERTWGEILANALSLESFHKSYALVVGISEYDEYADLPTAQDAERVARHLIEDAGFDHVHLLTEDKATVSRIRYLMIDRFPEMIDANDRFVFYWSGHGISRSVGSGTGGYLPLAKTPQRQFSSMISMRDVQRWDDLLEARQTLYIIDSCFSGLAGVARQSDLRRLTLEQLAQPSRQIMTAGTAGEETIAVDRLGGSVFTAALLDGLAGAADASTEFSRDGVISVNELIDYVKKRVALERSKSGWTRTITPQLRDLAVNEGAFFFLSTGYTVASQPPDGDDATDPPETKDAETERTDGEKVAALSDSDPEAERELEPIRERPSVTDMSAFYVVTRTSNVRAGPATSYDKVTLLRRGQKVFVTGRVDGRNWYRITRLGLREGFIHGGLIVTESEWERSSVAKKRPPSDDRAAEPSQPKIVDTSGQDAARSRQECFTFDGQRICENIKD